MIKRIYSLILALMLMLMASSCDSLLDVSSSSSVDSKELFESEGGFRSAVAGVYTKLINSSLYGYNSSVFLPEMLARNWDIPTNIDKNTDLYRLREMDVNHLDLRTFFSGFWLAYYNAIVQTNDIIAALETSDVQFSNNMKEILLGECLGIRAFLHFEVLRYFGPIPSKAILTEKVIPYMTEVTNDASKALSIPYSEVVSKIINDFDAAEKLLEKVDPVIPENQDASSSVTELMLQNRTQRLNYYAVLGLKARCFQWIGEKDKAAENALKVVDKLKDGKNLLFEFNHGASQGLGSMLPKELVFSLHSRRIHEDLNNYFSAKGAQSTVFLNSDYFFKPLSELYELRDNPNDVRRDSLWWFQDEMKNTKAKLVKLHKYTADDNSHIPIIRISELYLLLAECLPQTKEQAFKYFDLYKAARGMNRKPTEMLTTKDLEKEYRKEFIGDGVMFFFYKRHAYETYDWPTAFKVPSLDAYVMPIPEDQAMYE